MSLTRIQIKAIPQVASQRTKNRIREHGPYFLKLRSSDSAFCFDGAPGILVESEKDGWVGWLPTTQIIIIS